MQRSQHLRDLAAMAQPMDREQRQVLAHPWAWPLTRAGMYMLQITEAIKSGRLQRAEM